MDTGGSYPESKEVGGEAEQSPQPSAGIKNTWRYTSISQYAFTA
jgi:hypothetical protein